MSKRPDSPAAMINIIRRKAPDYLDLLTNPDNAVFEKAFDAILEKAIQNLESNRNSYAGLDEVGLTGVLTAGLSVPGLTVTQETHSNGHVDLTVEADHCVPARKKLGEAKIYRGPANHIKGLTQLLDRYTTGRELGGLMIVYVRKEDISGIVKKMRQEMDAKKPLKQKGSTRDHVLKWSFRSTHTLPSKDQHEVSHIGCNLSTK